MSKRRTAQERFDAILDEVRSEAVKAERERLVAMAENCGTSSESNTAPMTVERLIEKWCSKAICFDWGGFRDDLTELVKAQAR